MYLIEESQLVHIANFRINELLCRMPGLLESLLGLAFDSPWESARVRFIIPDLGAAIPLSDAHS